MQVKNAILQNILLRGGECVAASCGICYNAIWKEQDVSRECASLPRFAVRAEVGFRACLSLGRTRDFCFLRKGREIC